MLRTSLAAAALLLLSALVPLTQAATIYVASNGVDGPGCGAKETPCRSISRAIDEPTTVAGDKIIVGPGRYGDLDGDGTLGETGEETPAAGCGCMLAVNKAVSLTSSDGAAATIIDARSVASAWNVALFMDGGEFGRPGKGFTVTNTSVSTGDGIVIDSQNIAVRGNQVVRQGFVFVPNVGGDGITTAPFPQTLLIEANQVTGWYGGIAVCCEGATLRKNQVSRNVLGIATAGASMVGNVVTANSIGISMEGSADAVGNAVYGNSQSGFSLGPFPLTGTLERNNIFGNGCGLRNQQLTGLIAANNFWGAATGPGADPADDVCHILGGTTTTAPFATTPFKVKARIKP